MSQQALAHGSDSTKSAFELLVDDDGRKKHDEYKSSDKLLEWSTVTVDREGNAADLRQSTAVARAPASMSAGEVLEELLGRLYISPDRLKFLDVIGEGGFASVHKCELQVVLNYSATVAVKKLKPEAFKGSADLKEFLLEANILRKMHHPHIVELLGVGADNLQDLDAARSSMFLVQEYMGGGDLKNLLVRHMGQPFDPLYTKQDALRWSMHLAAAMYYLHTVCRPMIIHRDLKLENVLLTDGPMHQTQAKIADFGLHKRGHKGNVLSSQGPTPVPHQFDPDRSYYGGASYYSAVLEHDKALITTQQQDDSLSHHSSHHSKRSMSMGGTAMSGTSARLLHLIMSDGSTPMDDVSVHRKKQAIQALEQSDRSGHTSEDSSLHWNPPDLFNMYRPPRSHAAPALPPTDGKPPTTQPAAASLPPSRMTRSSSQGNLAQKRVSFMDSIPERRNSDSRMPRLSLDITEGMGPSDSEEVLQPETRDGVLQGGHPVSTITNFHEEGARGGMQAIMEIAKQAGVVSDASQVHGVRREGDTGEDIRVTATTVAGLKKNDSYIGLISLLGAQGDGSQSRSMAAESPSVELVEAGLQDSSSAPATHAASGAAMMSSVGHGATAFGTGHHTHENAGSTGGHTNEISSDNEGNKGMSASLAGTGGGSASKAALGQGAKMVQASSGGWSGSSARSLKGLSGSRSRSQSRTDGSLRKRNGSMKGTSLGSLMEATQQVGSLLYMAPEMTLGQPYNEKVDVFSFGVLMYELFLGQSLLVRLAMRTEAEGEHAESYMNQYAENVANGFREDLPSWWPKELRDLISDCWHQQPSCRPSFAKILERLHELHSSGAAGEMDLRRKKGYSPANDCGCSIM